MEFFLGERQARGRERSRKGGIYLAVVHKET